MASEIVRSYRRVTKVGLISVLTSTALWLLLFGWGNTLGGFELTTRAFTVGGTIGLVFGIGAGVRFFDVLLGSGSQSRRFVMFCASSLLAGGIVAAAVGLALNRFLPTDSPTEQLFVVMEKKKIKGGWSVTLADAKGRQFQQTFDYGFGSVEEGATVGFIIQHGYLGYPYYHQYIQHPKGQ